VFVCFGKEALECYQKTVKEVLQRGREPLPPHGSRRGHARHIHTAGAAARRLELGRPLQPTLRR
jgi:hypothetical protein